jgi:heme/copper-type cytochrome/quinol oxidase subunit 2
MSISDAITSIGTLVTISTVVVGALLYIITRKKPGQPSTKVLIIISAITTAIIVGIVGTAVFISASTTITINGQKNVSIPGFPAATEAPTATPSPTPTLSPTPTPISITKNLDIPCPACSYKLDIKLTTIVIDTTKQKSNWNFTLTDNGDPNSFYLSLVLEDNTGQKYQGGGLASTDRWNMSSGQSIQTYATFDVVHGTNYLLNITLSGGLDFYQTETITF